MLLPVKQLPQQDAAYQTKALNVECSVFGSLADREVLQRQNQPHFFFQKKT